MDESQHSFETSYRVPFLARHAILSHFQEDATKIRSMESRASSQHPYTISGDLFRHVLSEPIDYILAFIVEHFWE